jgi:hypothetical protein
MRILVLDTYYPPFLREHYANRPGLADAPYAEQLDALMARSFGTSDAYSHNLRTLGHEAEELVVNCVPLQARWAAEHGERAPIAPVRRLFERAARPAARLPVVGDTLHRILRAQVEAYAPDVVYVQDMRFHTTRQIAELRAPRRLIVGQIASAAPSDEHARAFDLILTSFPHFVERFRALGVRSEYFRIGFDERVLDRLRAAQPAPAGDLVFVGGLDPGVHGEGIRLLELLCGQLGDAVTVYGYGAGRLAKDSLILPRYRGEAWGLEMYRVLAGARVVLNRHIAAAEGYANNMRLYEATGVGAALLTDEGRNLAELFAPGREVATYSGPDLVARARELLADEPGRAAIAAAGQERTLSEHTYARRMAELAQLLERSVAPV